jgi:hypothetical protein
MVTRFGWNSDNMFFLTRDGDIEILHSDDDWEWDIFNYANQCLMENRISEKVDVFGRNYIDKLFIRLCLLIHLYWCYVKDHGVAFKLLACNKIDDNYIVRVVFSNETLEMELSEMAVLFEERCTKHHKENYGDEVSACG